ncbi:hypothetical protein Gogos_004703 [Gossypium gossypioides]|uniref:Uncharacterized protein n=1 Tax=Gossypium gossypioides TaxID=34282 RepID=A0A7J9CH48_GOSGO|nr:hypothetical protein [Gossypium gossypioides]
MTDSPLTSGVARLYLADKAKHDEIASEWTLRILYLLLDERSVLEELEGPTIMASKLLKDKGSWKGLYGPAYMVFRFFKFLGDEGLTGQLLLEILKGFSTTTFSGLKILWGRRLEGPTSVIRRVNGAKGSKDQLSWFRDFLRIKFDESTFVVYKLFGDRGFKDKLPWS